MIDYRFGRYQDVLQDVTCDALICDPPYSERTHVGRRTGSEIRQSGISYNPLTEEDAHDLAARWSGKTKRWAVIFGDHITWRWHATAWEVMGWYVFGPVYWIKPNAAPRVSGDGPTSSVEIIMVARKIGRLPPERSGSRPGHYIVRTETGGDPNIVTGKSYPGKKPLELMKLIISDYTMRDDLICDPFAGEATTLLAAASLCRKSVGAEELPDVYERTMDRINSNNHRDYAHSKQNLDWLTVLE